MKKPFLFLFACSLFMFSCKKEVTELPPATQTGANTFGARVNGNIWIPQRFGPFNADNLLEARMLPNGDIYINARNFSRSPVETEFELLIKGVTGPGTYALNTDISYYPTTGASYGYYVERNITPTNEWITSAHYGGSVTITRLDNAARFVSGTFQFNANTLYNAPQPISVTEGRFDVRLQ
ncbi:MAG TPA: DUF6252 family protein [Chitinophagaceae bacterium]|nr:DUF6252 family protein [Chitinophagaceae bacterium]